VHQGRAFRPTGEVDDFDLAAGPPPTANQCSSPARAGTKACGRGGCSRARKMTKAERVAYLKAAGWRRASTAAVRFKTSPGE
jgi:hypothetical protein